MACHWVRGTLAVSKGIFLFLKMLPFCCPIMWANCTLPISEAVNCNESRFRCRVVTFGAQGRSPPTASDVGEHGVGHTHAWGCECVLSSPCLPDRDKRKTYKELVSQRLRFQENRSEITLAGKSKTRENGCSAGRLDVRARMRARLLLTHDCRSHLIADGDPCQIIDYPTVPSHASSVAC